MLQILLSGFNSPRDIPGCKMWLDASQLSGADGSAVSYFPDLSGNAAHMNQSTGAYQPILKTSVQNGKNILRFDGTQQFMEVTDTSKYGMLRAVTGGTMISVNKMAQRATQQVLVTVLRGGTSGPRMQLNVAGSSFLYAVSGNRLDSDTTAAVYSTKTASAFSIYTGVVNYNIATAYNYFNGKLDNSGAFQTTGSTSNTDSLGIKLGAGGVPSSAFAQGDICETIVYNRVLSANELRDLHLYLSRKWGIAVTF